MKQRVATDERPFQTGSTDESGVGRDTPSEPCTEEPTAALVVPPDGGWGWVVVAASFMCNFLVDGIILTGGTMNPAIRKEFNASESQVAPINSLCAGFYLLGGPFVSALANKYGFRVVTIIGSLISSAGFAVSYYATSVEYLYVSYGIVGGIGLCMIFMPSVLTVGFYFEKWRALATGLALCGSGVGIFLMSPIVQSLVDNYGWRTTVLAQAGMLLLCIVFGSLFRPILPVQVILEEEPLAEDVARRHEVAVEKLNSMLKLQSKLDSGISMPPEMKFMNKVSPHTWMGVPSNTHYPTAEEVFRGSSTHINGRRRSSATAGTIKNSLGTKPMFIDAAVAERDEQEDTNTNGDNTAQPLIGSTLRVMSQTDYRNTRRSSILSPPGDAVARPLYRDDIFFGHSLSRLPQYTSRTSLGYHMAVTHVPDSEDERQEKRKCQCCPPAVRRALATMLDVSLFKSPTFVILTFAGFFTMLGFFVPFMYVQNRGLANEMSPESIEWLVSTIGVANIVGRVVCGLISSMPKVSPLWLNNIALTAGGIATMMSSLCYDTYFQYTYCVIFGLAVACFASLRSILVVEYLGLEKLTNCFGLFLLFQGIGALLGAPIAGTLFDRTNSYNISFYVSGGFILFSSLLCYPIDRISKWEKARSKDLKSKPEV